MCAQSTDNNGTPTPLHGQLESLCNQIEKCKQIEYYNLFLFDKRKTGNDQHTTWAHIDTHTHRRIYSCKTVMEQLRCWTFQRHIWSPVLFSVLQANIIQYLIAQQKVSIGTTNRVRRLIRPYRRCFLVSHENNPHCSQQCGVRMIVPYLKWLFTYPATSIDANRAIQPHKHIGKHHIIKFVSK